MLPHLKNILSPSATAAAKDEVGRTNLIAYIVGRACSTAAKAMSQAYAAAGTPKDAGVESADKDADAAKADALSNFDNAAATTALHPSPPSPMAPGKVARLHLKAVALHGKYLITHQPTDLKDYQMAAQNARAQNPPRTSGLTPPPSNAR